jgi:ankyrin repeat protein
MLRHILVAASIVSALALPALASGIAAPSSQAAEGQALMNALRNDDEPLAYSLIAGGANVNSRDDKGNTPLIWAVQRRSAGLVARLLKAGADPNILCVTGLGPLQLSIANRASDIFRLLIASGAKADVARDDGESALMTAARTGQLDVMTQLMSHGADVNAHENQFNQTALMWSAGYPAQVKLLLAHGVDIRARTKVWEVTNTNYTAGYAGHPEPWASDGEFLSRKGGQTALFFAVQENDVESVKALTDAGVDVNDPAADGSTALLLALYKWAAVAEYDYSRYLVLPFEPNLKIANLLLDRGANVNVTNAEGYSPLHGATLGFVPQSPASAHAGMVEDPSVSKARAPFAPEEGMALVNRILDQKSNVNAQTRYPTPGPIGDLRASDTPAGSSPLHIAALSGNAQLMSALLSRGGDPNLLRKDGQTPLSLAVKADDLSLVRLLVEHGADVKRIYSPTELIIVRIDGGGSTEPRGNQTILHIAAAAGAYKVVAFLAEHGAPLNLKNNRGESALDLADIIERRDYVAAKEIEDANALGDPSYIPKQVARATKTTDAIGKAMGSKTLSNVWMRGAKGACAQPAKNSSGCNIGPPVLSE